MRTRALLPAAVAAILLTVTGCGADSGSDTGVGAEAGSPTAAQSSPRVPVIATGSPGGVGGAAVPEALGFTATTVDGKPFDAGNLAGRPVVLWFWAPWCPACKAQAAETAKVATAHRGTVSVVGVAGLDTNTAMKDFVAETRTGVFPHLSDEKGEVWKRFEVTEQSRYVILDKNGTTVYEGVLPAGRGLAEKVAGLTG
ncbi:redoxin family protein [Streptomyces sp. NPDC059883]|uniref:redoxin family protein n=1 Tax=unclassified Streptomyces TaxID=2593676 RepID=UPI003647947F